MMYKVFIIKIRQVVSCCGLSPILFSSLKYGSKTNAFVSQKLQGLRMEFSYEIHNPNNKIYSTFKIKVLKCQVVAYWTFVYERCVICPA